jgi:ubiquinone/menaquinone biosynthesis C-methylase UbiE
MEKGIWEKSWKNVDSKEDISIHISPTYPLGRLSKFMYDIEKKSIRRILLKEIGLPKNSSIIDIGCGEGRTLSYFREFGLKNSIGIDFSNSALKICEIRGFVIDKDVFLMDALKTRFKNNSFDLVFAEGLLEHYENFLPIAKEMTRLSKKYIMITQPDHFSITGKILNTLISRFWKEVVKEYDYRIKDFIDTFDKLGFKIKIMTGPHLNNLNFLDTSKILLFEKETY